VKSYLGKKGDDKRGGFKWSKNRRETIGGSIGFLAQLPKLPIKFPSPFATFLYLVLLEVRL
jgi:hypothetical protein